jgi:hypothetical protein
MDQNSAPREWGQVGYTIDFEAMSIVYEGGFSVPIVGMIDRFDMETDDPGEAEELLVKMPPDGFVVCLLMEDLYRSNAVIPEQKH